MEKHLFKPYRALGYITSNAPFKLRSENLIYTIMVSIGNSFQLISSDKLIPYLTSNAQDGKIKTMQFYGKEHFLTNRKNDIIIWKGQNIEQTFSKHTAAVTQLMVLDNILLSLSKNNELLMWDLRTRLFLDQQLPVHSAAQFTITSIVHPQGYFNKVLLGSQQGKMQLWNLKTCKLIYTFNGWGASVVSLVQSPVVNIVAVGLVDGRIILHDLKQDATVATFTQKGSVTSISFRSDGTAHMATGTTVGKINIWDLEKKRLVVSIRAHKAAVGSAEYLRDEPILISNGADNAIKVWTFHNTLLNEPTVLRERSGHSTPPTGVDFFNCDLDDILTLSPTSLRLMNLNFSFSNRYLSPGKEPMDHLQSFALNPRHNRFFDTAVSFVAESRTVNTWNVAHFTIGSHKLQLSTNISAVTMSSCGHFAIVGCVDGQLVKFNVQSGVKRGSASKNHSHAKAITSIFVDATNRFVVSASIDCRISLWNLADMTLHKSIVLDEPATTLVHHPESSLYAAACDDFIVRVFDVSQCDLDTPVRTFNIGKRVEDLCFSHDGRWLIVASDDNVVRIYDIPANVMLDWFQVHKPITSLTFSPKSEYLITTHANELPIFLWTNQSHFGSVLLTKPEEVPSFLELPSHHTDQIKDSSNKANSIDVANAEEADQDHGVPDIEKDDVDVDMNVDEQEEGHTIVHHPQIGNSITMSQTTKSKWQTLLNLDVIKQRNKPLQAQSKPELAPFFLTTLPGLEPKFATPQEEAAAKASTTEQVIKLEQSDENMEDDEATAGWGDWATPENNEDEDEPTDDKVVVKKQKHSRGFSKSFANDARTKLSLALEKSARTQNYTKLTETLINMTPSAIDYEIRSLSSVDNDGADLRNLIDFLCYELRTNDNFDMMQTLVNVFVQVHGDVLFSGNQSFAQDLAQLQHAQQIGWNRIQKIFHANILYPGAHCGLNMDVLAIDVTEF
ncbi:hypothetical protein SAMD00019534_079400 [Acytostelium subglobosum LB1]|uniref:hypothetical protein n=1 Tax=Acytostelium subglobosum LB1 TaxID=1410327 RepID=UPI000644DFBD|nr:hypothetical protein SAMD00019534_079400 [Acytostelium subglobosum LB1]GAM24765.1 hypothetical protein SAMD00019534_079400 [Acytostelium subglobosum LB1]|eukprot:XP_012752434.1 hypothetical protein SAMD00019534_079400 [Acytostelium subglobosum LB1]